METSQLSHSIVETVSRDLIGKYGWMFIVSLIIFFLKSSIEKLTYSLFVFMGSDYKTDDVIYLDGRPGRIVRVGFTKTVFFMYDVDSEGKVIGGTKLVIQNERLASLNIEKPLPLLDLSKFKTK